MKTKKSALFDSMLKTKLKSFALKDIKALKKRRKKIKGKYHRAGPLPGNAMNLPPVKFLDPFHFHHIISDFIIIDEISKVEDPYFSGIKVLISLKHVVSIDFFEDFVYAKFQNSNHYPISPEDLVISRLRSMGKVNAHNLANTIAEYKELCLLIKNTKKFGFRKEFLSSFSPKHLKFLQEYFKVLMTKSISAQQMKECLNEVLDNNKRNPVFFLMYDEYKDYVGTQIIGVGMNKTMKKLIDWKDFQILEKKIWCVRTEDYFDYINSKFKEYLYFEESIFQKLFINTKYGFIRINFEVKKWFVTVNNEKKVICACVGREREPVNNLPVSIIDAVYDENEDNSKSFNPESCERNHMWNRLIDAYFEFPSTK